MAMVKTRSGIFVPSDLAPTRRVNARWDAAQTTHNNYKHWANADGLSATSAASPGVRRLLRNRSRYEYDNNSYLNGMIKTLAFDCIGTGPRLQMQTGDEELDQRIEEDFNTWSDAIGFAAKLRTMRQSKARDGEVFAMFCNNPRIGVKAGGIELDLQLLETEMISASMFAIEKTRDGVPGVMETDGIILDEYFNPVTYLVLPEHPGSMGWTKSIAKYIKVPAGAMLHYFSPDRPGQTRGIPETTPALNLCAQLRRWTLATLTAAENIANITGVILSKTMPNYDGDYELESPEAMDTIELERGMFTVLPENWGIEQPKAEQPTSTYAEFKQELINEIARCLNMAYNKAAGNSSKYNYASGRLDFQTYFKFLEVERSVVNTTVADPTLHNWLDEWQYVTGLSVKSRKHTWFYDGAEHVDPQKEANATKVRLANGTTSIPREYAKRGLDWREEFTKNAEALGVTFEEYQRLVRNGIFENPLIIQEVKEDEETDR